ncbi:MAG: extracellular solute-binding protein [Anaerolineae bacterium]
MMLHSKGAFTAVLLLMVSLMLSIPAAAQSEIVLTISFSDFMATSLSSQRIVEEFEAQHPNTRVEIVSNGNLLVFPPGSASDLQRFLSDAHGLASDADVITVDSTWLLAEATQAGYVLDLAPLANGDDSLDEADFVNAAWESFQWDGGLWALPSSYQAVTLSFQPAAFDAAPFPYPDAAWTLSNLADAARALAAYDADGHVMTPGLMISSEHTLAMLIRSLSGSGVYDDTVLPAVPDFSSPSLADIVTTLQTLEAEGVIFVRGMMDSYRETPMMIGESFLSLGLEGMQSLPLPGGHSGMIANGFAVSRGTPYPEMAYQLARFVATYPEISNSGGYPALNTLPSPEWLPQVDVSSILPASELRFMSYVTPLIKSTETQVASTLQVTQAEVTGALAASYAARDTVQINIPLPPPEPVLAEGEIALSFAVLSSLSPLPNQGQWTNYAREFVEADAQVGALNLEVLQSSSMAEVAAVFDCFYVADGDVTDFDDTLLTNIDPLLASDPEFDAEDYVGSVLQQVTRSNQIWALPLTLEPEVMWYDREAFAAANLPVPQGTWTLNDFTTAYAALTASNEGVLLTSYHFPANDIYVLMLIAAYGGLPIDFRTNPPTVDFTDPAHVDAIRQVLDMAKAGRMTYLGFSEFPTSSASGTTPLILSPLDDSNSRGGQLVRMGGGGGDYRYVSYPTGTQYTPIAYHVGAAYISANAANPEACYRFMRYVAEYPQLFTGMPVRRSQINSPEVLASRGEEAVSFYNVMDAAMASPNVVEFPTTIYSGSSSYVRTWLDRAFDRYVLEDADLETVLADAQVQTEAYLACVDAITDNQDYDRAVYDCQTSVDIP